MSDDYLPFTIQSLVDGQWHTRSRLKDLNHALVHGKITELQLMEAASVIMQKWMINYNDASLRLHKEERKKNTRVR